MRLRVEQERGRPGSTGVPYKAGRGGLMDVDFLASGAMLELRKPLPADVLPSVPAMLRACASGPRLDRLLDDYAFLRRVESRARWVAARGVERVPLTGESAPLVAELVEPGLTPEALGSRLDETRARVRSAFDAVTGAGSIGALSA
jgi:glutamate-ammonia-ligase adenylyltransferase